MLGQWTEDSLKLIIIPLPKENDAKHCKDYMTISFFSPAGKALTRVTLGTLNEKLENALDAKQFGFRKEKQTRNVTGCMKMCRRGPKMFLGFCGLEENVS